jgi:hypothetical protein
LFSACGRNRALRRGGVALALAILCAYFALVVNNTPAGSFNPDTLAIPWLVVFVVSLYGIVRIK